MKKTLRNILFVSGGYPSKSSPSNAPFVGYRLAYLQKHGIHADVLSLNHLRISGRRTLIRIAKYLLVLFFPVVTVERYSFVGRKYRIYKCYYGFLSHLWVLLFVLVLSRLNKYSLIHYHWLWYTRELALLKRITNLPAVISVHGSDMHTTAVNDHMSYARFKKAIASASSVIYVSNALRNVARSIGLATEKDIVIHNGYEPSLFFLSHTVNSILTVGFVGHLISVKRADKLPDIFMNIRQAIPDAKMIIVGSAKERVSLEKYMKEKFNEYGLISSVKFIGEVRQDEVARYYELMDILLLPSRNEGYPNVAIEARACGVSVVGSSNGGIPEAIGDGGIVVPEGEDFENRFAGAVIELSKKLPSRESIHQGVKGYSWDNIILQEIAVYNEIVEK